MSEGFLAVVGIAFAAQLAVLPGEKVQLIIAGLSTRYRPLLVVSAAGTAFAGWTALEILIGEALVQTLPGLVLDAITAGLFLLFAGMLLHSAPSNGESIAAAAQADPGTETDGGRSPSATPEGTSVGQATDGNELDVSIMGWEVPEYFGGFLPIFALMAVGEFGDKTQLVTISLAAQYGAHPGIWVGEMLAIVPVSLVNAYVFHRYAHRVDRRTAHVVAAGIFAFFGLDTVLSIATGFSVWETAVDGLADALLGLL